MSWQRVLFNFVAAYRLRSRMAKGLDLATLRASEMPQPRSRYTYGCTYEGGRLAGVAVTTVRPARADSDGVLVYLHGGAYVVGIGEPHWWLLSRLCHETGRTGVMVDYRLAPEHPYPAALDDALAVVGTLAEQHGAEKVVVVGDSAGGGLAVATAMKRRDEGQPLPGKLGLLSPWLDLTMANPAIAALEKKDRVLARRGLLEAGEQYAGGSDPKGPYLSPLYGEPADLPPTLLQVGGLELFLPDCRAYRQKTAAQNGSLSYREYPKLFHVWPLLFPLLPEGEEAVREMVRFIG